jgi:hypothetical protein
MLRFLGLAFFVTGVGAIADYWWGRGEAGELWAASAFALALPTAALSIARAVWAAAALAGGGDVVAWGAEATAAPAAVASANAALRAVLARAALGVASVGVAARLAPFLGGWQALAARASREVGHFSFSPLALNRCATTSGDAKKKI